MKINPVLLSETQRFHYDEPTCGVLVDVFQKGAHWHAVAIAENSEWYCHNGFGDTKEQAMEEAIIGVLKIVKDRD
ncbi:hypothetical protein AB1K84_02595 [Mesobacillus foraminis]|uniref:hypothetical protein n=1 Tax=Mesobacillus foraminis TaxID=279826 RepID=UPI0039A19D04